MTGAPDANALLLGLQQSTGDASLTQQVSTMQQVIEALLQRQAGLEAQMTSLQAQLQATQTTVAQQAQLLAAMGVTMPISGPMGGGSLLPVGKRKADLGSNGSDFPFKRGSGTPVEGSDGNWKCSSCGNVNWERRDACNRCGLPKSESMRLGGSVSAVNAD